MTKVAAMELGPNGIRVNSVHPGVIDTPMVAMEEFDDVDSDAVDGSQPIPRMGRPDEVAKLMVFLASDDSSYSTGSEFVCDGGNMAGPPVAGPGGLTARLFELAGFVGLLEELADLRRLEPAVATERADRRDLAAASPAGDVLGFTRNMAATSDGVSSCSGSGAGFWGMASSQSSSDPHRGARGGFVPVCPE